MSANAWRRRTAAAGLVVGVIGYEVGTAAPARYQPAGWAAAVLGGALVVMMASDMWRTRRGTRGQIHRWTRQGRRNEGVQSWWQHQRTTSVWAMRRQATVIRPSLASLSRLARYRVPVATYACRLGRNGRRTVWLAAENVVVRVAGARSGKTSAMAARIIETPGAAVITSTRVDLLFLTAPLRAQRGPLLVFNPANVGEIASTLKWSPLSGCTSIETAMRRAADMIPESSVSDRENWNIQARRVLAPLLYAAARSGGSMARVLQWVAASGADLRQTAEEVTTILADAPESMSIRHAVTQFFGTNDRTRTSIVTTVMPALSWLSNPKAAQIGDAAEEDQLDVDDLLDTTGTVYLLGSVDGATGALTGALVGEIAHRAAYRAECSPGGRLDPCLLLALDEAALVAPGPLDRWTSDMGGRGIVLDIAVQSLAWLDRVWGETGRRIILGNAAVVLVGSGCKDPADLEHWEALSGWRDEERQTTGPDGNLSTATTVRVPVLSRDQIANLPKHRAIVYGAGPISIIRTPIAYKRRDVRQALRLSPYKPVRETSYAEQADTKPAEQWYPDPSPDAVS